MFAIVEIGGVPEAITMSDYFLGTSAFWQSVLTTSAVEGRADLARSRLQVGKWPQADLGYWVCMFISGTLGTVIGNFCSHNMGLDAA
jgi:uncharacterized membrane-anchored protein